MLLLWEASPHSTLSLHSAVSPHIRAGGAQQQRNEQALANVKLWTFSFLGVLVKSFHSAWQGCNSWGERMLGSPISKSCQLPSKFCWALGSHQPSDSYCCTGGSVVAPTVPWLAPVLPGCPQPLSSLWWFRKHDWALRKVNLSREAWITCPKVVSGHLAGKRQLCWQEGLYPVVVGRI